MAPKVDKAKQAQREKIAVDKTFGQKNKNKSKVVQKYIKSITSNAAGAPKGGKEQADRDAKDQKQKELQKAALMNSLFNMATDKKGRAFDPVAKKKAKEAEEQAIAAGSKLKEEVKKEIVEGIANSIQMTNPKGVRMSELGGHPIIQALKTKHADVFKTLQILLFIKANDKIYWVDDPDNNNPMVRCLEDVEAEVAPDERPIEEIIEERRAALPPGGTPVTLETFKAWKETREAERLAQVETDRQKSAKKDGTKGLVGMSGRDLFTYDASLFVDDDGAVSADEYDEREEDPEDDEDDDGKTRGVAAELAEDNEEDEGETEEEGGEPASSSGAKGSEEAPTGPINETLFMDEGDL
eukprot:CAMPEP_0197624896 /NCGR_PEP_ID=MMETSP1338-20131121/4400_1 /TAXON_ID=43686 ORGANISM="Pelagodinium beii, Strain RCC1491" /NCGR_SAMPLE_ID=MMETSP1338 /ASSEMBLY_ACC=CAM_ASM_000754 /LENGTH=353 /DNA_ID=CAMNT_0043195149 /DNA_START=31 /DNA_END=1090 /DNA_ORIENTATION=+